MIYIGAGTYAVLYHRSHLPGCVLPPDYMPTFLLLGFTLHSFPAEALSVGPQGGAILSLGYGISLLWSALMQVGLSELAGEPMHLLAPRC